MIRTYCDRCGERTALNPIKLFYGRDHSIHDPEELDLCEDCADALKRFLGTGNDDYETLKCEDRKAGGRP